METAEIVKTIALRVVLYGAILFLVSVWIFSGILLHAYRPKNTPTPQIFNLSFEKVTFSTKDNVEVKGWWVKNRSNTKCIILCHGLGADKSDMLNYMPFLYKKDYSLLVFDFRGHGESKEKYTSLGYKEVQDLLAAVEFAKTRGAKNIGVIGRSMGGAVALRTAEICPDINAVISDASFARLKDMIKSYAKKLYHVPYFPLVPAATYAAELRSGFDYGAVNPVESAAKIKTPLLLIHGLADGNISYADSEKIFAAANGPKKLLLIKNADHIEGLSVDYNNYSKEVLSFLEKYL